MINTCVNACLDAFQNDKGGFNKSKGLYSTDYTMSPKGNNTAYHIDVIGVLSFKK